MPAELVSTPISTSDGADRIWMFEEVATTVEDAKNLIAGLLRNPAAFVAGVINDLGVTDPQRDAPVPFNSMFPVTVSFQYGIPARKGKKGFYFLFKGEYGTNMITVLCPNPLRYPFDEKIATNNLDLWKDSGVPLQPRVPGDDTQPRKLDVTIVSAFNCFYAHFDINIKVGNYHASDYFDCLAWFVVDPRYIVATANAFAPSDVRITIWNDGKLVPALPGERFHFGDFGATNILGFEIIYASPPLFSLKRGRLRQQGKVVLSAKTSSAVLVTAEPCLKFTGGLDPTKPAPPGFKWEGVPISSASLSGWRLVDLMDPTLLSKEEVEPTGPSGPINAPPTGAIN